MFLRKNQKYPADFHYAEREGMNYIALLMVELSKDLPADQQAGGQLFLAGGGIPAPVPGSGAWTEEQCKAVQTGVDCYLTQQPEAKSRKVSNDIPTSVSRNSVPLVIRFSYNTGYDGSLETVRKNAEQLYHCLFQATLDCGITVTLYESI